MTSRRKLIRTGVILFTLLMIVGAAAENAKISYPPVPAWAHEIEWTTATNGLSDPKSAGTRCLLYESQDRPKQAEQFVRIVELMENANGVQDSGSLRLGFNPDYQELCLHVVAIHRAGKTINRLDPSKVRIIQPEPQLNEDMVTGNQTAVLFIEDLRVGDVLEYSYTIRGANPVLKGHYSKRFTIQNESPVERELFRVVWESDSPLHHRLHLTTAPPAVKPQGMGFEYEWCFTNLPPIPYEDCQPASFEPFPYVEVSDFDAWRRVVDWAIPLYDFSPTNIPPEMQELVAQWQSSGGSDGEKAQLALDFVQDNLRYTGIELGPDSYRPTDPVETFQKRFGDCKGKSVLLQFLLKQMNIESRPALVSASDQAAIADHLPSPFAFDHVILQIKLDGKPVWVDPTMSHQGGAIEDRYVMPLGKALVIRPGNDALEDVPRSRPQSAWQQSVVSTFDIKDYKSPVGFKVLTEYRGASANDMRDQIASGDPGDLARNYLNYYTRLYSGIVNGGPMKVKDDRQANVISTEEFYTITNLWKWDDSDKLWKTTFYADNLNNAVTDPDTRIRKTPLALSYPRLNRQKVIVHLPDGDWQIPDLTSNLDEDAFSFHYHRHFSGTTAVYDYESRTKLATVPVESVPAYLAARDHVADMLSDSLERPNEKKSAVKAINWLMVMIAVFGAGGTTIGCLWYWRRARASGAMPPPLPNQDGQLQGLGGWLILVAIGLCLAPIVRFVVLSQNWEGYFSAEVWQRVAMPQGSAYHPLYGPLLIFELLGNIFFSGLNLLVLGLFFSKRRAFPRLFITFIISLAAFLIADDIGCALIPALGSSASGKNHTEAIRAGFYALVWTLYMIKSKRVKATFVR